MLRSDSVGRKLDERQRQPLANEEIVEIKIGTKFTNSHGVECIVSGVACEGMWNVEMWRGIRHVGGCAMTDLDIHRELGEK